MGLYEIFFNNTVVADHEETSCCVVDLTSTLLCEQNMKRHVRFFFCLAFYSLTETKLMAGDKLIRFSYIFSVMDMTQVYL